MCKSEYDLEIWAALFTTTALMNSKPDNPLSKQTLQICITQAAQFTEDEGVLLSRKAA